MDSTEAPETDVKLDEASEEIVFDETMPDGPPFVPILKVWREVLASAEGVGAGRIEPQWANRICSMYPQMRFADMPEFHKRYFAKVEEMRQILLEEVATDPEYDSYTDGTEDASENGQHYKALLTEWQVAVLRWEVAWDAADPAAAAELAAISEVHKLFFAEAQGLVAHLDNIQLEYTTEDQIELNRVLTEVREGR